MSDVDGLADVLPDNLRRVWPLAAQFAQRVNGVLMGGTAVALHLRHRVSEDLDVMTLRKFSGRTLERHAKQVADVDTIEASDGMFHAYVNGVKVDVFRALPTNEVQPSEMRQIQRGPVISGLRVGSIPDLMATKLDVIMYRPKLRDYLDLAELDRSGACRLEPGLGYYCRRFGYTHPPQVLSRVIALLDNPGALPEDPLYSSRSDDALQHLRSRVPSLQDHLADMRDRDADDAE